MRTRSLVVSIAAIAAGCAKHAPALPEPGPISGDPIELTYHLHAGDVWKFDVESVQRIGAAGEGGPRMTLRYTLALRLVEERADGGGKVAIGFEDLKMEMDPPTAMPRQLDFSGVDITAVLSRTGALDDLRVSVPGGRDPDIYKTIVRYAIKPFHLADRPVRRNEAWTAEEVVPTRIMGMARALDFQSHMRSWITELPADGAHIQIAGSVELPKQRVEPEPGTIAKGPVEVSSAGTMAMTVVFDRERGMVKQLAGEMQSKMSVVTGDDSVVVETSATTTMRLRPLVAAR